MNCNVPRVISCIAYLVLFLTSCQKKAAPFAYPEVELNDYTLRTIETNGIRLRFADMGEGPLVVLIHGFPESWYSWRRQIPELVRSGFRVVAPDMRGYGGSDSPETVETYDIKHLTDDIIGILDVLDEETAVLIGHDWGAQIAWDCALRYPERIRGVIGLANPHYGREQGDTPPIESLKQAFGDDFFYILYFQEPGVAEAELDADPRGVISRIYASLASDVAQDAPEVTDPRASAGGIIPRMGKPREIPAWFTESDLEYYVNEFERTGFRGGINYYRNIDRNWILMADYAGQQLQQPFLFIAGAKDHNLWGQNKKQLTEQFQRAAKEFHGVELIRGAYHFCNQSHSEETNRLILRFLESL